MIWKSFDGWMETMHEARTRLLLWGPEGKAWKLPSSQSVFDEGEQPVTRSPVGTGGEGWEWRWGAQPACFASLGRSQWPWLHGFCSVSGFFLFVCCCFFGGNLWRNHNYNHSKQDGWWDQYNFDHGSRVRLKVSPEFELCGLAVADITKWASLVLLSTYIRG